MLISFRMRSILFHHLATSVLHYSTSSTLVFPSSVYSGYTSIHGGTTYRSNSRKQNINTNINKSTSTNESPFFYKDLPVLCPLDDMYYTLETDAEDWECHQVLHHHITIQQHTLVAPTNNKQQRRDFYEAAVEAFESPITKTLLHCNRN